MDDHRPPRTPPPRTPPERERGHLETIPADRSASRSDRAAARASTSGAAEYLLVVILVLLRTVAILQSIPRLAAHWNSPTGDSLVLQLAAVMVFTAWSLVYMSLCFRARTVRVPVANRIDVALACVVLLSVGWLHDTTVIDAPLVAQWAVELVVPVAVYAGVLPRVSERLAGSALLTACLVAPILLGQDPRAVLQVTSLAISLPAQTAIGYYVAEYLRTLAADAEAARVAAARTRGRGGSEQD